MRSLGRFWKLEQSASAELDMETVGVGSNWGHVSLFSEWTFLILKEAPLNGRAWLRAKTRLPQTGLFGLLSYLESTWHPRFGADDYGTCMCTQ